jgi:hypothetical protein
MNSRACVCVGGRHNQFRTDRLDQLDNPRDIQFGNTQPAVIRWKLLAPNQQRAFLDALGHGVDLLRDPTVVESIVRRKWAAFDTQLLTDAVVLPFAHAWAACRIAQTQPRVYGGEEVPEMNSNAVAVIAAAQAVVRWLPQSYGAANRCLKVEEQEASRLVESRLRSSGNREEMVRRCLSSSNPHVRTCVRVCTAGSACRQCEWTGEK